MHRADVVRGIAMAAMLAIVAPTPAVPQAARAPIDRLHRPGLNHVYVVLDAATYAAIRDSRALRELLGRADGGLPDYAPASADADRIFFRGRQTYLELFAPENRFGEPVGKVGMALGHDTPASLDALEEAWRGVCGEKIRRTSVAYERIRPPVLWYDAVQRDDTAAGTDLAIWAMAYRPEFHRWQSGAPADAPSRTARADILAPRAADGQGRFDIASIAIDVLPELRDGLDAQLEAAGFLRKQERGRTRWIGDGWELTLRTVNGSPGLVSLGFNTDRRLPQRLALGQAWATRSRSGETHLSFAKPGEVKN
ncbi:DUF5829 family protein [Sphingomonas sp.]